MKNRITSLILIILFASCKSNTIYDEPLDLIPKDSMMLLLKDLYLATAAKNIKNARQQKKFPTSPLFTINTTSIAFDLIPVIFITPQRLMFTNLC